VLVPTTLNVPILVLIFIAENHHTICMLIQMEAAAIDRMCLSFCSIASPDPLFLLQSPPLLILALSRSVMAFSKGDSAAAQAHSCWWRGCRSTWDACESGAAVHRCAVVARGTKDIAISHLPSYPELSEGI